MPDGGGGGTRRVSARVRAVLRVVHRDAGYFVVGLTFVYAVSGLAVNHIKDWDPNFRHVEATHHVPAPLPADDDAAGRAVLSTLGISESPKEIYRTNETDLEITLEHRTLHADPRTGVVTDEREEPRPFVRLANWLHLNRGKKAWTYVADGYAVLLLYLATSGLFMLPGRKGLLGRGAVLAGLGVALPVLYVVLSGGP
ncbi:MAG TPA: PepSY-associated TM helix domain-containing protein [Polyangiaceae bacterium]|nr:PepSY-associated TM helix domain-containing protein [Polyangiaceae bacterium]